MVRHRKQIICYPAKKNLSQEGAERWEIKDGVELGNGYFSNIFQVCENHDCEYVMKLIKNKDHEEIEKEVFLQKKCSESGICLPVIDWWLCPSSKEYGGVIISPIVDESLLGYIKSRSERSFSDNNRRMVWGMMKKALELILDLHRIDVVHRNLKLNHFMIDTDGRMFLIDMREGRLFNKTEEKLIYSDYVTLVRSEDDEDFHFDVLFGIGDRIEDEIRNSQDKEGNDTLSIREAEEKVVGDILKMSYHDTEEYSRKTRNTWRQFVGIPQMKRSLKEMGGKPYGNIQKFKEWALEGEWEEFGEHHYDWWMFPINRRSSSHGWKYTVYESDIQELKQDSEYMADYILGAKLLIKSWGWNPEENDFYPRPGEKQEWKNNDVRLKKLSLSLKLFGQYDLFEKLKKYTTYLIKNNMIFNPAEKKELIEIFELQDMAYFGNFKYFSPSKISK